MCILVVGSFIVPGYRVAYRDQTVLHMWVAGRFGQGHLTHTWDVVPVRSISNAIREVVSLAQVSCRHGAMITGICKR